MNKGLTLLETVVVIALIAILSLFGINTINNFRRDADLDNAANELVSEIRVARSKSMAGEIKEDEKEEDFDANVPNSLPEYGLNIIAGGYELVRRCVKVVGNCVSEPAVEKFILDDDLSLEPLGSFYFERITGNFGGIILTISQINGGAARKITVSKDFNIVVEKI